jgi:hypothetical protein
MESSVLISKRGSYGVSAVGRGTAAAAADLAFIWVDDEIIGVCNFSDPGWNLCTARAVFEPGIHKLHISSARQGKPLPEIAILIITKSGG